MCSSSSGMRIDVGVVFGVLIFHRQSTASVSNTISFGAFLLKEAPDLDTVFFLSKFDVEELRYLMHCDNIIPILRNVECLDLYFPVQRDVHLIDCNNKGVSRCGLNSLVFHFSIVFLKCFF